MSTKHRSFIGFLILLFLGGCHSSAHKNKPEIAYKPEKYNQPLTVNPQKHHPESVTTEKHRKKTASTQKQQDVWLLIRERLQFDRHVTRPSVQKKITWFAKKQSYFDRVAERARPYLFYIVTQLKQRDMPLDLALLPIVESAYQPFAYSRSHASGIWQFIPGTGRHYGLIQDWWYDGRRDIVASTEAALDYLEMLHKHFNKNWLHALAAYNFGEKNIEKAIERNRKAGKKTDFWSLKLPRETLHYVPALLAVAEILKNDKQYNIQFQPIDNKPYFEIVDIKSQIDLATVSDLADLDINEVYILNPGFNRYATRPDGPHRILVPLKKASLFKEKLANLDRSERLHFRQHHIQKGESLSQIAVRYNTNVTILKEINRLRGHVIYAGQKLLIPTPKKSIEYYALSDRSRRWKSLKKSSNDKKYVYTVKRGDRLWDISRYYGISIDQITAWNGISRISIIRPGQKLAIWIDKIEKQSNTSAYVVKHGDSLWSIAKAFSVSVNDLVRWNKLKKDKYLQPGQTLIVQRNTTST